MSLGTSSDSDGQWCGLDHSISELRDWLGYLHHMLRVHTVVVGDIEDIEETVAKQKVGVGFTINARTTSSGRLHGTLRHQFLEMLIDGHFHELIPG